MRIINPDLTIDWIRARLTGRGVTVAVIDSGIDASHPELDDVVKGGCIVKCGTDGEIVCEEVSADLCNDSYGHGTGVAGCIHILAPEAHLISVKVLNEYNTCTGRELLAGLQWALEKRIKLINLSLATTKQQFVPALYELCERAYRQDAIIVAAKRNFGELGWPAVFSSVVSVDRGDFPDRYWVQHVRSSRIEFAAHGTNVDVPAVGGGCARQTGTRFATPHVAGMIALLLEAFPDLLPWEAKSILRSLSPKNPTS